MQLCSYNIKGNSFASEEWIHFCNKVVFVLLLQKYYVIFFFFFLVPLLLDCHVGKLLYMQQGCGY